MEPNDVKRAAGYIRVSTVAQAEEGESLDVQRESINQFCKKEGYELVEIYADEGISGGNVKDRFALLQCIDDAKKGEFSKVIIHRLSRFGRNARELLENNETLVQANIELHSISENIDFGNKYGKAMLGMFAVMAELDREIIRETNLEGRISKAKKKIPTAGKYPYGRTYDGKAGKWVLDKEAKQKIEYVVEEYLAGGQLFELAKTIPMSLNNLYTTLKDKCGDTWRIEFEGHEPIEFEIPRLLEDDVIEKVRERLSFNHKYNRKDIKTYLLSGFIRCEACGRSLTGQTQKQKYSYYIHPGARHTGCDAFTTIPLEPIEHAVFETIIENFADVPSFEKAIADSLPNEEYRKTLKSNIEHKEQQLKRVKRDLDKLVEAYLDETLEKSTIKNKEQELLKIKESIENQLPIEQKHYKSLPDINTVKEEADLRRRRLLEKYSGEQRLQNMTFEDKRLLLHWLFDGKE